MTHYHSHEPHLTFSHKWRGAALAALAVLILLGLAALQPLSVFSTGQGEIVIPGEDWHGNVRRSTPAP